MSKLLITLWLSCSIALWFYSYGFVDFNLTLSSHPLVMNFVTLSQSLAMFHRSTSLYLYLGIIVVMFIAYTGLLVYGNTGKLNKFPWKFIAVLAITCSLAYPFLSSDVFKYLFAAKELLVYHANPHMVAPQVFEGDTWLRFMRWIHTPSPYGPVMTLIAIPYYLLGFGKFVPALYLFKLDQIFWYGLSVWLIGNLSPKKPVLAQLIFALNPLVLIEWLVNAHNDAPMITLLLLSLYFLTLTRRLPAFISLLFSVGIKYVTVFALPFIFIKKLSLSTIVHCSSIILFLAPLLYHYSYQYQPWYVSWIIPFVAILGSRPLIVMATAYSFGALLRYSPYISTGLWIGTPTYFALLTFVPLTLTAIYFICLHFFTRLTPPAKLKK